MIVTHIKLKNWRNFREVDVPLRERTYLLGANAAGKSNFLDVFRFLRDVSKPQGGGLQKAIYDREGIQKLRCLHARRDPEVSIEVHLAESIDDNRPTWRYLLGFKPEGKGAQRTLVSMEQVWHNEKCILNRPDNKDREDTVRLTQTALEQIQVNANFRELATFFGETTYLHLVPQLLKYSDKIGGQRLEEDPFGQGFLERIAKTPEKTRDSRLKKIGAALQLAVPQFKELRFTSDKINGRPHLEAMYSHYRPNAGWQREEQFSDGTLRLLALLWVLLEGDSLLLLEEPELSLNDAIVREIPQLLQRILRDRKRRQRQVLISTHSEALLSNPGIDGRGVLLLEPVAEGTRVRSINDKESIALRSGLSVADVILPQTHPHAAEQLGLWE
ncbi:AAA family ATPase [Burkholderia ubonensis]|uniref:AAA family ATPase n=1 Tax=Burkholderia ubonensis TaxID=101571 RepID=UPI0009B365D0|nr:AAA family ATPase [Burkholderia ubonensis]PAJ88163.1 chromosome segregation protein SMC [Burkholderia ubonensis]PAJ96013.1 chromosome segregation protein SMC [Burkholderia ubonensis]PAK08521.1 chromosome segregation protein SMC [Burkholderia ubonensis]RQP73557.1 chromosome segregation protein SMC [Burkholderia ubonensis]RQP81210.1 chromosome segregation protein SMC [Burkholderia ubonensis]